MAKFNPPTPSSIGETYTFNGIVWEAKSTDPPVWEKSSATETGNTEGTTGGIAYYDGKSSIIKGALNAFYDETNERVGIGTSGPTELLDVRGGITASGRLYAFQGITSGGDMHLDGDIIMTNQGSIKVEGNSQSIYMHAHGVSFANNIAFADGSTQGSASIEYFSRQEDGNPLRNGNPEGAIYKGIDMSASDADDISISQQSADTAGVPQKTAKYVFSIGNNIPKKDATNTFSHAQGNIFITEIGASKYAPGNSTEVFKATLDLSSSTYIGVTGGVINYKILGNEVLKATDNLIQFGSGISADMGVTFGGTINCQDQEATRPKLKDYSETFYDVGDINASTAFDFENGNVQKCKVTGTDTGSQIVFSFTNPPADGIAGTMTVIFENGLAHGDIAFASGNGTSLAQQLVKWPGDNAPTLSSSGFDIITFMTHDAGFNVYGFVGGLNFS